MSVRKQEMSKIGISGCPIFLTFFVYQDNYFSEVLYYVLYKTVQASVKCPKIGLFGTKAAAWCLKKLDLSGFRTFNCMRWVSFKMETRRHEMFKKYFKTAVYTKP